MKKVFSLLALSAAVMTMTTACSDNNDDDILDNNLSAKEEAISRAVVPYINNTVLPTYKSMADAAIELHDLCLTIQSKHAAGTLTSADVKAAADTWKKSRKSWELSEAFLFGPAADYYIDPHIDSWPLDKNAMDDLLAEIRAGKEYTVDNNLGYGLLGFHSVEYMLFELCSDGQTSHTHSLDYTPEELKYLTLVTEDLRNQCVLLEACWAGTDNVSPEKQEILEEAELDKNINYGEMMINAGQPGSTFKTYQEAQNFFKYAQTYIVRFMFLMTDEALTSLGKRVPDLMDYSDANILVDFNADLNKQLYDLMELTEEEIIHIENTVNNLRKSRKEMT